MTQPESLVGRVAALLTAALQEVLKVVEETEFEYQENTVRTQRENQSLKRRVHQLESQLALQHAGRQGWVVTDSDAFWNLFNCE